VSDTFCAPHQQAGEGEADEMVHSIPTEAEIQGIHQQFSTAVSIGFAGAYSNLHSTAIASHGFSLAFHSQDHQRDQYARPDKRPQAVQFC